jgi:hypothetical protein
MLVYVSECVRVLAFVCTCMFVYTCDLCVSVFAFVDVNVFVLVCLRVCVCVCVCVCRSEYVRVPARVCVYSRACMRVWCVTRAPWCVEIGERSRLCVRMWVCGRVYARAFACVG